MSFMNKSVGVLVIAVMWAMPVFAAVDAAGNIVNPAGRPLFIENPDPHGKCLRILVPGIRCPIPNPAG